MRTDVPEGARAPPLAEALISPFSLVVGIGVSIVLYGLDPQVPMLLGVIVASLVA
jgi:NhaC family Na+:H+ antiporter